MIPITELRYFVDTQPAYRILKPWWDVFTDYISIVMLMIAVFGGTLQVTQDKMICLPCKWVVNKTCDDTVRLPTDPVTHLHANSTITPVLPLPEPKGIKYDLDRHQYNYVDAVCYENKLHWFAKYFPYLVLLHTLIFLACSNFWFKFPRTSSKLEHFVSILLKCFDSPWTTRALSETVVEESDPKPAFGKMNGSMDKKASSVSKDVEASVPMLQRTKSRLEQGIVDRSETGVLDKKEGEQAKALFEKVKKFRTHVEEGDIVYRLYIRQTIIKVIKFVLIICYTGYYVNNIKFDVDCIVDIENLTGYRMYRCAHPLATLFKILASFYISLVVVYGLICMYTLSWMLRRSLKKYSFESNLTELELIRCDLERIPHSIFSLHNLQEIDLKDNNLKTIEEIISFQHLHRLICLKLWYNQIAYIPIQIGTLTNMERLYLNRNKIEKIPSQLFFCRKLRFLDLSHNNLTSIPADIGFLQSLQYFAVTANRIEALPPELFQCRKLRTLNLGNNCLQSMPSRIGELASLTQLELRGNRLECLPVELGECRLLKRSAIIVEEDLFSTLPPEVKEQLWRAEKEQA
ncbi:UNVERIFIED_CONTAM: hypothetical protein FKN15_022820 [Acipenser sinensis]